MPTHPLTQALPTPGALWGHYPERPAAPRGMVSDLLRWGQGLPWRGLGPYRRFLAQVELRLEGACRMQEPAQKQIHALRARLSADGLNDATLTDCFVLLDAVAHRVLGQRPRANQVIAARAMLDRRLVELDTGEGKTLAVALAAASAALAGIPVHVMTANDYLATRDHQQLAPFYAALGLQVGVVTQASDAGARREAYAGHITYCTAKELGFDYLRDRVAGAGSRLVPGPDRPRPLLRGLCMAIIDEADSILLDDARVPLILARSVDRSRELEDLAQALGLARQLAPGAHFELDHGQRRALLNERGRHHLAHLSTDLPALWQHQGHREDRVALALGALHLFHRDRDYLVRDGQVHIIDAATGRVAPGRAWSQGLHQCIELKEGCAQTQGQIPSAQITFQQLFRRYLWCCGTSGTLREARTELAATYALPVVRVPPQQASRRHDIGSQLLPDQATQWRTVLARVQAVHGRGQPVLIGVDSVADSESLATLLRASGLVVQVLNAHQDRQEARLIALAGQRGRITVATNMAGRGADIPLGAGVDALGGLYLISCQHNAEPRTDRQLAGRCARQGQAGTLECLRAFDSPLLQRRLPAWVRRLLVPLLQTRAGQILGHGLLRYAQLREQHEARAARGLLIRQQRQIARLLAFSGRPD